MIVSRVPKEAYKRQKSEQLVATQQTHSNNASGLAQDEQRIRATSADSASGPGDSIKAAPLPGPFLVGRSRI